MLEIMNRYGRVSEIFYALLEVAPSDEIRDELSDFALGVFQEQREEEASSLEAEVVRAIVTSLDQVVGDRLPIKAITNEVNEERDEKDKIRPQKVGWVLARLGFKKARMSDVKGNYAIVTDRNLIDRLTVTYDVRRAETLNTFISPKSCSDAQLLRDHLGKTSLSSEHSEQLSKKGEIGEPSGSSFYVETFLPETSTAPEYSALRLNCRDEGCSARDLILRKLRSVKGSMSWDYTVEQVMKVITNRVKAESYVKKFQDEGLLAQTPDGYWKLTK